MKWGATKNRGWESRMRIGDWGISRGGESWMQIGDWGISRGGESWMRIGDWGISRGGGHVGRRTKLGEKQIRE